MLDTYTRQGRILASALECAAKKSWAEVSLLDIAEGANLPLSELRAEFATKSSIIAGVLRAVDQIQPVETRFRVLARKLRVHVRPRDRGARRV